MSVEKTVDNFIQGVKAGKYHVVAYSINNSVGQQLEFAFTVDVNGYHELLMSLKDELTDICGKRDRLDAFMAQETFKKLSSEEWHAMQRQRESMADYIAALQKRIELIKEQKQ